MGIEIEIAIGKEELRLQESAPLALRLKNADSRSVRVIHPSYSEVLPHFRIVDVRTGAEEVVRRKRRSWRADVARELKPGESLESVFDLAQRLPELGAGQYELSALYETEQGEVESKPIRLTVRGTTPRNLFLDTVQGDVVYGAWVDLASSTPEIVRSRFRVGSKCSVTETRIVASAVSRARPILSLGPSGADRRCHWVAWTEGSKLRFTHVSRELGNLDVRDLEIGGGSPGIIGPLFSHPLKNTNVRARGLALVRAGSRLHVVALSEDGATGGAEVALEGPPPAWAMTVARSTGKPFLVEMHRSGGAVSLSRRAWSEETIERPAGQAQWSGAFIAAGATLDVANILHGAVLLWERELPALVEWLIDADGVFLETGRRSLDWPASEPIADARVRLSGTGRTAVLLRKEDGTWFLESQGRRAELPEEIRATSFPLDLAFRGTGDPILVFGKEKGGFGFAVPERDR